MQDFSEEIELNSVEIIINNKIDYDFMPMIYMKKSDTTLKVAFNRYFDTYNKERVSFSPVYFLDNEYPLTENIEDWFENFDNTYPYYGVTWDIDQLDASYDPTNFEKGYLKISEIDTINTTVRGSFRSEFIRTRKGNTFQEPRGKKVKFEGQFYSEYEIRE